MARLAVPLVLTDRLLQPELAHAAAGGLVAGTRPAHHHARREHRRARDRLGAAVGGLERDRRVLALGREVAQPRRVGHPRGDELAVAFEEEALVERVLAVVARGIEAQSEGAPTREHRRLPHVPAERGEASDAGAPDAQAAAVERVLVVADAQRAGGAEQLLEARATHEVTLFLGGEHTTRDLEQRAALPRRRRRPDVVLELDRHDLAGARARLGAADLRFDRRDRRITLDVRLPVLERLHQLELDRAGAEDARLAVGAEGVVHLAAAEHVEDASVGEREVELDVVGLPLVGDRLDADAGHAVVGAFVPHPGVHRLAHLRVGRLLGEDELAVVGETAAVIDGHGARLPLIDGFARLVAARCHESAGPVNQVVDRARDQVAYRGAAFREAIDRRGAG